jgi:hypothetical protein
MYIVVQPIQSVVTAIQFVNSQGKQLSKVIQYLFNISTHINMYCNPPKSNYIVLPTHSWFHLVVEIFVQKIFP